MNIRLTPHNYTLHGLVLQYLFRMILLCFLPNKKASSKLVGDEGLEPPTSSLSVTRSNQLS